METSAQAQSASDRYPQAASPIHTILVLAALGGWAFLAKIFADQMSTAANPNRVRAYVVTLFFEWLMFVFVVTGVRRSGASVLLVLGDHWHSVRQVLRDIGIAAGFWIVAAMLLWVFAWLLRIAALGRNMQFMLPHGGIELTLWIALSVTAGICEETIFRGYLQRQFMALTKSAPAGILLSAVAFGAAHAYQGFRMVILISLFGAMFGILAYWRGSVRPGMITHAWQDSLGGVLGSVMRH
ncbi:MAG: type II CAAX endopeptidase family protein [Terriglobales bacterium]|jgi:membrane protease YdiL (CAAX protease family)